MKFYEQLTVFLIITCLITGIPASANETAVSATGVRVVDIAPETENVDSNELAAKERALKEITQVRTAGRTTSATTAQRGRFTSQATRGRTAVPQEQEIQDKISKLMIELATLQAKLASIERESHNTGQANIEAREQLNIEAHKLKDKSDSLKTILNSLQTIQRSSYGQRTAETPVSTFDNMEEAIEPRFYGAVPGMPMTGRSISVSSSAPENKIVVIPSAEMNSDDIQNTIEDMSIMMRIFDNKIGSPPLHANYEQFVQPYIGRMYGNRTGVQVKAATEGIYIAGYGAIFLMNVDFPLTEPATDEEEQIEQEIDTAWEQAKQEIFSQTQPRRRAATPARPRFDRQKVKELGDKVIMTLKHAGNIRAVQPDEFVTVSISGAAGKSSEMQQIRVEPEGNVVAVTVNQSMGKPTFLTIRVKKADLDSFTGDKTDRDEFYDRFEITSH